LKQEFARTSVKRVQQINSDLLTQVNDPVQIFEYLSAALDDNTDMEQLNY